MYQANITHTFAANNTIKTYSSAVLLLQKKIMRSVCIICLEVGPVCITYTVLLQEHTFKKYFTKMID